MVSYVIYGEEIPVIWREKTAGVNRMQADLAVFVFVGRITVFPFVFLVSERGTGVASTRVFSPKHSLELAMTVGPANVPASAAFITRAKREFTAGPEGTPKTPELIEHVNISNSRNIQVLNSQGVKRRHCLLLDRGNMLSLLRRENHWRHTFGGCGFTTEPTPESLDFSFLLPPMASLPCGLMPSDFACS